jgi:hypothetical protein
MLTRKIKNKKLEPVENVIKELKERIAKLDVIRDAKIPFYEKLPKDSPFYKHYMSVMYAARIEETGARKILEDRNLMQNAAATILDKTNFKF